MTIGADSQTDEERQRLREGLLRAVRAGVNADRQNAAKWTPLYQWFADELGVGDGRGGGDVIGKLVTETKQIGNRCDEMAKSAPKYAVISVIGDVTEDKLLKALRKRGRLPSLRCIIFLRNLTPTRLVVFDE